MKNELTGPLAVKLPIFVANALRQEAQKAQRSLSQELRFRILDSWSRIPKEETEE